jgi:hypothetical protein
MSDGIDAGLRHRLEESNIEPKEWPKYAPIIQAACDQNGFRPVDLDAWSLGYLYQVPDGSRHATIDYVIGVLGSSALVLAREKGAFKKKLELKVIEFANVGDVRFWPEDNTLGSNWGSSDLQGVSSGGQPVFRLGWGWSGHERMVRAMRERDRIAGLLPT